MLMGTSNYVQVERSNKQSTEEKKWTEEKINHGEHKNKIKWWQHVVFVPALIQHVIPQSCG